ncbi:redox-regulated ATPase YchF [bacterium]|nr:redox-regulated ATPase YchF [bacterium]
MGFKCGLVGLPNAGKSTVFNALTRLGVEASAYPFCTINPHFGIVPLEDGRLDIIREAAGSAKITPTVLEFVDIAGLVKGASKGEGLGNQFLSHIQAVDAIAHVVRCFDDANVSHPYGSPDPERDAEIVETELALKDLDVLERHSAKVRTAARSGNADLARRLEACESLMKRINRRPPGLDGLGDAEQEAVRELNLLSFKPVIFLANTGEAGSAGSAWKDRLEAFAASRQSLCLPFSAKIQAEIAELPEAEQAGFLKTMGIRENGVQMLIQAGNAVLRLITFFTANANEARAWTVPAGTPAAEAAGRVHTDFDRHFIRVEVIPFSVLETHRTLKSLHDLGLVQVHGRDYAVRDGDWVTFRIRK